MCVHGILQADHILKHLRWQTQSSSKRKNRRIEEKQQINAAYEYFSLSRQWPCSIVLKLNPEYSEKHTVSSCFSYHHWSDKMHINEWYKFTACSIWMCNDQQTIQTGMTRYCSLGSMIRITVTCAVESVHRYWHLPIKIAESSAWSVDVDCRHWVGAMSMTPWNVYIIITFVFISTQHFWSGCNTAPHPPSSPMAHAVCSEPYMWSILKAKYPQTV